MQLVTAREPEKSFIAYFWHFGRWRHASVMLAMDNNSAPSKPEGSGTFRIATWNIVDGRGGRMTHAAAGLAQMGVGLAVLTETKLVDDRHPKTEGGERAPRGCRAYVEGGRLEVRSGVSFI